MKKEYTAPLTEAIEIKMSQQLLQASKVSNNVGLEEIITGSTEPGRSPDLIGIDDPVLDMLLGQ